MYKRVTYSYLGYANQDTSDLEASEKLYEQKIRQQKIEEASNKRRKLEESEKMISQNVTNSAAASKPIHSLDVAGFRKLHSIMSQ